jgi:chromosome segregation ATPase
MDKKPRSPITAQRDDMIGRNIGDSRGDSRGDSSGSKARSTSSGNAASSSGGNTIAILALVGLIAAAGFGWLQYQDLLARHDSLQARFELLESRLSSTDESVTQSGAAMQLNISKNKDELKKHWSEIRKLWGVSNDKNKSKIAANKKDIAFLVQKRSAIEKSVAKLNTELDTKIDKANSRISDIGVEALSLTEELNVTQQALRSYSDKLNQLKASMAETDATVVKNVDAIEAMDSFRRKTTQKLYELEQRSQRLQTTLEPQASDEVSGP